MTKTLSMVSRKNYNLSVNEGFVIFLNYDSLPIYQFFGVIFKNLYRLLNQWTIIANCSNIQLAFGHFWSTIPRRGGIITR